MALTKKDLELIAEMTRQTVVATVQAMGAAPAAPTPAAAPAVDLEDDKAEEEEARRTIEENERKRKEVAAKVEDLLPHLMQARHLEVFKWLAKGAGRSLGDYLQLVIRNDVMKNQNAWRESQGMGGGTTNNKDTIAELARLREENQ